MAFMFTRTPRGPLGSLKTLPLTLTKLLLRALRRHMLLGTTLPVCPCIIEHGSDPVAKFPWRRAWLFP
eukprot:jgi/Chlat1/8680/Chrsp88S08075